MGDFADDLIEQGIEEMVDDLYPLEEEDDGFFGDDDD